MLVWAFACCVVTWPPARWADTLGNKNNMCEILCSPLVYRTFDYVTLVVIARHATFSIFITLPTPHLYFTTAAFSLLTYNSSSPSPQLVNFSFYIHPNSPNSLSPLSYTIISTLFIVPGYATALQCSTCRASGDVARGSACSEMLQ